MELLFPILENVGLPPKQFIDNNNMETINSRENGVDIYNEDDGKKDIFNGMVGRHTP